MKFDGPFLQEQYRKDDEFLPASYQVLDTYALALWWQQLIPDDPGPENLKLGVLAEYLGVEVGETHQAGADVLLTVGIYKALTGKFVMHHIGLLP
jgi:DNA polymerase III epsilon subunit-like protein